jgi:hypothetical protein
VIRITRGQNPDWFAVARRNPELMSIQHPEVHASEYSWAATDFDFVIDNNGSIEDLYAQLKNLV